MRHATMTGLVLLMFIVGTARVDAATVQVTLTVLGSRDINVAVAGPPFDEFHAQRSSWGSVTFNGALIGYYVLSQRTRCMSVTRGRTRHLGDDRHSHHQLPNGDHRA